MKVLIFALILLLPIVSTKSNEFDGLFDHVLIEFEEYLNNRFPFTQVLSNLSASPVCKVCHSIFSTLEYIPAHEITRIL